MGLARLANRACSLESGSVGLSLNCKLIINAIFHLRSFSNATNLS